MLCSSGLSKSFWGEALATTTYLANRSPNRSINLKTPYEMWYGRSPNLSHLRIFGCSAYVHQSIDKLEPRSIRGIFLGYPIGTKGYRICISSHNKPKIVIARNVIFNEKEMFKLTTEKGSVLCDNAGKTGNKRVIEIEHEQGDQVTNISDDMVHEDQEEPDAQNDQEDLSTYQLARDRTRREIHPPTRFAEADIIAYALAAVQPLDIPEPNSYEEAVLSPHKDQWTQAMKEEIDSLMKNNTWELVDKPASKKITKCRWIFKVKEGLNENDPVRFKARLVAKGFTQVEGVDYTEIFSPVVKYKTIRLMLSLAVQLDLEVEQLDVKTAFLNGFLDEEIYMSQPPGFVIEHGDKEQVCKLKRSLYGLKQSPRQWNKRFDTFMHKIGFHISSFDHCLYYKNLELSTVAFLLLYVDDMLIMGKDTTVINGIKVKLKQEFEMKELGPVQKILGIEIWRNKAEGKMSLKQSSYIKKIIHKFNMNDAKTTSVPLGGQFVLTKEQSPNSTELMEEMKTIPYAMALGCLMYIMVSTRPDLAHSLSILSKFMANSGMEHWKALKWLLRYLKGTWDHGLVYEKTKQEVHLTGFVDADYASNKDNRRSTTAYMFMLNDSCICWKAQLQSVVALSTTEAEFMATTEAFKEAVWLQGILQELRQMRDKTTIFSDSQSSIHLCKNPVYHEKSKHIDIRLYWIREKIEEGTIKLEVISTDDNPADMGTKVLSVSKFRHCHNLLNLRS